MTTTNFIIINSRYRTLDSNSTSDFSYSIGESLEVDAVTIKDISIPHVSYNINQYNNVFSYVQGGVGGSFTVPVGQYSVNDLMSFLSTQLTTLFGSAVTVTLDSITKKIIFTTGIAFHISSDEASSPLSKYLGIPYASGGFYPAVETAGFTLPELPQLQGPNNYLVASNVLSQGYASILTDGKRVPIIMPVPVTVEYGQIQQYESADTELNTKKFARLQNIQNIDIKIYDDDLNIVDLHNQDVEIVLKVRVKDTLPAHLNKLGLGR